MGDAHVDYMLSELARAAILMRISELCHELREAREGGRERTVRMVELQSQRLELWQELHEVTSLAPRACASIVRKYSTDTVRAQRALRELNKLRTL